MINKWQKSVKKDLTKSCYLGCKGLGRYQLNHIKYRQSINNAYKTVRGEPNLRERTSDKADMHDPDGMRPMDSTEFSTMNPRALSNWKLRLKMSTP